MAPLSSVLLALEVLLLVVLPAELVGVALLPLLLFSEAEPEPDPESEPVLDPPVGVAGAEVCEPESVLVRELPEFPPVLAPPRYDGAGFALDASTSLHLWRQQYVPQKLKLIRCH